MRNKTIMAILIVSMMMVMSIVPLTTMDEGDAAVEDNKLYSYTLNYNAAAMTTTSATITTTDDLNNGAPMTPVSHANQDQFESLNFGSWTWNETTGIGPFNSFYAAFDMTDGNRFYSILNPNDLTKTIDGESLEPIGNYNIMWVLPTVYWKADNSGNLTLTNDSTAGGTAWAHTIDGHTYKYVAYGVYEGSKGTVGSSTVLKSSSGSTPTASQTREVFRTQAHAYTMDSSLNMSDSNPAYSMLWNFYQWTLYKMCSLAVMNDWNSQKIVGGGHTYGSTYAYTTGTETNQLGPYAGYPLAGPSGNSTTGGHAVKLFIENAWGGLNEFVDGVVVNGTTGMYISQSHDPTDSSTKGQTLKEMTLPSSSYAGTISIDEETWGFQINGSTGSATVGVTDYIYTSTSSDRVLYVGGSAYPDGSFPVRYGLSCAPAHTDLSNSHHDIGSRLAFVFDVGPTSNDTTVTITPNETAYGTVTPATVTAPIDSVITISGNTLTIDETTVTATPTTATDQYTYAFSGWSVTDGATVTEDMTITATFTRTTNNYTVTFAVDPIGFGTISNQSVTVPYGTAIAINQEDKTLTIGSNTITATPTKATTQYTYVFDGWANADGTVTADRTITANFSREINTYTVTIVPNNETYGSVSLSTINNVPYGTEVSTNGNELTVGTTKITATPTASTTQQTFAFKDWSNTTGIIDSDRIITANFTVTGINYTITWTIDGQSTTSTYAYGTTPTHTVPTKAHYNFAGWVPEIVPVTEDAEYTATWDAIEYTVTWDPVGGSVNPTTSIGSVESAVPVPKPILAYNEFDGWYTDRTGGTRIVTPYYPQSNVTLYAHWTPIEYTVIFNATANGGTTPTPSATGTNSAGVVLPTATKEGMVFNGWYEKNDPTSKRVGFAGDIYHPVKDITLYALFVETATFTYSVSFDLQGGWGNVEVQTHSSEIPGDYTFTIPGVTPYAYLKKFVAWNTAEDGSGQSIPPGGTLTVQADQSVTLYAVWEEEAGHNDFKNIVQTIPYIVIVGLLLAAVGMFMSGRFSTSEMMTAIVGITIAILLVAVFMIPLFAGL